MAEVRKVFDSPLSGSEVAHRLLQLRQNSHSVADYAVDFCTLAAERAWNLKTLFDTFRHRLLEEIKDELIARELPMDDQLPHSLDHPDRWAVTGT